MQLKCTKVQTGERHGTHTHSVGGTWEHQQNITAATKYSAKRRAVKGYLTRHFSNIDTSHSRQSRPKTKLLRPLAIFPWHYDSEATFEDERKCRYCRKWATFLTTNPLVHRRRQHEQRQLPFEIPYQNQGWGKGLATCNNLPRHCYLQGWLCAHHQ